MSTNNYSVDNAFPLFSQTHVQPAIFVPIGLPPFLIEESEARTFLKDFGSTLRAPGKRPSGIVCISPRWIAQDDKIKILACPQPKTVHDFFGFPEMFYELEYPAEGSVKAAARVAEVLSDARIDWDFDEKRGFDFGCWGPLMLLLPEADIPVIQVSLHSSLDSNIHLDLGRALASLRQEGYLLLCTGGIVYNPTELSFHPRPPSLWASNVDDWFAHTLQANHTSHHHHHQHHHHHTSPPEDDNTLQQERNQRMIDLDHNETLRQHVHRAQPGGTHLLPLLVAAGSGGSCTALHRSWIYGDMSMAVYSFSESRRDDTRLPKRGESQLRGVD